MALERSNEKVNRRDFLKMGASALAGVMLPNILDGAFKINRAGAVEVKEGMAWEDGLTALKRDVFNAPHETAAWYTEGKIAQWRKPYNLGVVRGTEKDTSSDEQFVAHILQKEQVRIARRAHTHTIASIIYNGNSEDTAKETMDSGGARATIAPPSMSDIFLHIWTNKRWFKERGVAFEDVVLDPSGVWRISLRDGAFSQTLCTYLEIAREKIPEALENSNLSQEKRAVFLECMKTFDASCANASADKVLEELFGEYYQQRNVLNATFYDSMDAYSTANAILLEKSAQASPSKRQEWITFAIESARRLNIELSFEPYKN